MADPIVVVPTVVPEPTVLTPITEPEITKPEEVLFEKTDEEKAAKADKAEADKAAADKATADAAEKVEADKKAKEAADAAAAEVVELKAPEGSLLSPDDIAEIKAKNLPKEQAEAMILEKNASVKRYADAQGKLVETAKKQWAEEAKSDPVIGGEHYNENITFANRAYTQVADKDVIKFMNDSGLANHPMAIRMFAKIGKMMAEDRFIPGGSGQTQTKKSNADILYGDPDTKSEMK